MAPSVAKGPKALTWRVSNIPAGTTEEQLKQFFIASERDRIKVGSLCPDVEGSSELTATVLFRPFSVATENEKPRLDDDHAPDDIEIDRDFEGFTPLYCPPPGTLVSADIIAITGLAGHAYGSWEHAPGKMWLRDYVKTSSDTCRILAYGYNTRIMGQGEPLSGTILAELADLFLENLINMRDAAKCEHRPIIFIGHSLGCLIIKKAMTAARYLHEGDSTRLPVRAIIFFAAPHRGMEIEALRALVKNEPPKELVDELHPRSPTLVDLNKRFALVAQDIEILTCFEMEKTKQVIYDEELKKWTRTGPEIMMVDPNSAKQYWPKERTMPANANHTSIAKLRKGQGGLYPTVKATIGRAVIPTAEMAKTLTVRQTQDWLPTRGSPQMPTESPPAYFGFPQGSTVSLSSGLFDSPRTEEPVSPPLSSPASPPLPSPGNSTWQTGVPRHRDSASTQSLDTSDYPFIAVQDFDASEHRQWSTSMGSSNLLVERPISQRSSVASTLNQYNAPDHSPAHSQGPFEESPSLTSSQRLSATPTYRPASTAPIYELAAAQITNPAPRNAVPAAAPVNAFNAKQPEVQTRHSWTGKCLSCRQTIREEDVFYACIVCPGVRRILCDREPESSRMCSKHGGKKDLPMTRRRLVLDGDKASSIEWINPVPTEEDGLIFRELKQGNLEALNNLLQSRRLSSQVDHDKRTPLHVAVILNLQAAVRLCLKHGANLQARDWLGFTPLGHAVAANHEAVARDILDNGADPNSYEAEEHTVLGIAAAKGHTEICKILLASRAKINAWDRFSRTALYQAAGNENLDTCRLLLAEGANLEVQSIMKECITALGLVSAKGFTSIAKLFIDHGAKLEAKDKSGRTPLFQASEKGHTVVAKLLIDHGAKLESQDKSGRTLFSRGRTPLHIASRMGHLEVVKLLVASGARARAEVGDGWLPVTFAAQAGHLDVVRYLVEATRWVPSPPGESWSSLKFDHGVSSTTKKEILQILEPNGPERKFIDAAALRALEGKYK